MLDRMTQQSYIENGYPPTSGSNTNEIFNSYFAKYLNIEKDCGLSGVGCFMQGPYRNSPSDKDYAKDANGNQIKHPMFYQLNGYDNAQGGYQPTYYYKVLLKNGMGVGMYYHPNVTWNQGFIFIVDINGPNKGNSRLGQDVFQFTYSSPTVNRSLCPNTMLLDNGENTGRSSGIVNKNCTVSRERSLSTCKEGGSGIGCSNLIIRDGWKISEDYPWQYAQRKS